MGKASRRGPRGGGGGAGSTSRSASLDLFGCEDSGARLEELLDSLHCRHVMERLIQANFSENAAVVS